MFTRSLEVLSYIGCRGLKDRQASHHRLPLTASCTLTSIFMIHTKCVRSIFEYSVLPFIFLLAKPDYLEFFVVEDDGGSCSLTDHDLLHI